MHRLLLTVNEGHAKRSQWGSDTNRQVTEQCQANPAEYRLTLPQVGNSPYSTEQMTATWMRAALSHLAFQALLLHGGLEILFALHEI